VRGFFLEIDMNTTKTEPSQTIINGVQPPPPPKFGNAEVIEALMRFIEENRHWGGHPVDQVAAEIAKHWHPMIDGYELAKALEQYEGWDIDAQDVEVLDLIDLKVIRRAEVAARNEWAKAWNIQPPHPIGTKVKTPYNTTGVIAGVYEHQGATYLVKEDGCKQDGRHILIKFEDVELVNVNEVAT
jgi:hypothetical protein